MPKATIYTNYCSKTNFEKYEFAFSGALGYPTPWQQDSMHFKMLPLRAEVGQHLPTTWIVTACRKTPRPASPLSAKCTLALPWTHTFGNKRTHLLQTTSDLCSGTAENVRLSFRAGPPSCLSFHFPPVPFPGCSLGWMSLPPGLCRKETSSPTLIRSLPKAYTLQLVSLSSLQFPYSYEIGDAIQHVLQLVRKHKHLLKGWLRAV